MGHPDIGNIGTPDLIRLCDRQFSQKIWIQHFIARQKDVQVVVYDVEPRLFDSKGLNSGSYTLFLPYIDDPVMGDYMRNQASLKEYYICKMIRTPLFRDQTINMALRGLLGKIENKKSTRLRVENYRDFLKREKRRGIRVNEKALDLFRETIDFLTGRDIVVVLVFIPVTDLLNNIDPAAQAGVIQVFKDLAAENEKVVFLDYNQAYESRHDLFYDLRHLNGDGNAVITQHLIEDLQRVLP